MSRRFSIANRIAIWSLTSAFLIVLMSVLSLYWSLVRMLDHESVALLKEKKQTLSFLLKAYPEDLSVVRNRIENEWPSRGGDGAYVRISGPDGGVLSQTPGLPVMVGQIFPVAMGSKPIKVLTEGGRSFMALAFQPGDGKTIEVAVDRTKEEFFLRKYRKHLSLVIGAAFLICAVIGRRIAVRSMNPIFDIANQAKDINSSNLTNRIKTAALPVELLALADSFNSMLSSLDQSFDRLSRFSSDIAHELRTPLGNLRGEVEVALSRERTPAEYRSTLGSCLEEAERIGRIIESLLFLARCDDPAMQIDKERIDIGAELLLTQDFYGAAAQDKEVRLFVTSSERLEIIANRTLFQRAVGNLIVNAIQYAAKGGEIRVQAGRSEGGVFIEVADRGEGIASEHLTFIFDRFYRADSARASNGGGAGLGLSIVKSIMQVHRGSVDVESEPGQGSIFTLSFPA